MLCTSAEGLQTIMKQAAVTGALGVLHQRQREYPGGIEKSRKMSRRACACLLSTIWKTSHPKYIGIPDLFRFHIRIMPLSESRGKSDHTEQHLGLRNRSSTSEESGWCRLRRYTYGCLAYKSEDKCPRSRAADSWKRPNMERLSPQDVGLELRRSVKQSSKRACLDQDRGVWGKYCSADTYMITLARANSMKYNISGPEGHVSLQQL